jgi:4-diphosphocytidyl-2-C-methyl-D-erythritol kinase
VIVTSVTVRVPAKINLQLAVGPLRPDGYHGLVTVFHAVSLFDELTVTAAETDSIAVTGEGAEVVPANEDNLALRAVRALREAVAHRAGTAGAPGAGETATTAGVIEAARNTGTGWPSGEAEAAEGAHAAWGTETGTGWPAVEAEAAEGTSAARGTGVAVEISKRIPVAGGMAGGSADAAAALVACNELWGTGLSQAELCAVAASVGSDVAFAVLGGTAIGRGRGEQLTPVPPAAPATYHWVLALADGHLSTPAVFRTLDGQRQGQKVAEPELSAELMAAINVGDLAGLGAALSNDLQEPALTLFPALRKTLDAGREAGALGALVSGSGPTCFFLAGSAEEATRLAVALSGTGVCRKVATATGPVPGATVITNVKD